MDGWMRGNGRREQKLDSNGKREKKERKERERERKRSYLMKIR